MAQFRWETWVKLDWARLAAIRSALLILIGFGCLIAAAFLFHTIAGLVVTGLVALALDYLTRTDTDTEARRP